MRVKSADRATRKGPYVPPFADGDAMDQPTFHALYEMTPHGFTAELIGGIVHLPSPTSFRHGRPHRRMATWLDIYSGSTPHTDALDNTTSILGPDSEPQPDVMLRIDPYAGGQTRNLDGDYVGGACELVVEVAAASALIDLHAKKADYERHGVREYVVVLTTQRRVAWFVRGRRGFTDHKPDADGLLKAKGFPGLWLDPASVFERSTQRLFAALRAGLATPEHAAFVAKLDAKARKSKRPPEDAE
jgi:hypothetical protein